MADNGINGSIGLSADPGRALSGGDESKGIRWQVVGRKKSEDLWWEIVPERKEVQHGTWNKDPNAPRHELVYRQDAPIFTGGEGYRVYVGDLLLPVPPDKLELSIQNRNKTMDLVSGGQINLLKTPGLSEVKFTALLPNQPYHFAMYEGGYRNAHAYLDKLEALKVNRKSFPLRVLRMGPGGDTVMESTSLTASLEDYSILEDAERYGLDMAVDLTFKQFQPYGTKVYELTGDTAATEVKQREVTLTTGQETYTLQEGETLFTLSQKLYGNGEMQEAIYELNKDVIEAAAKADGLESSSNGNVVYAGTVLKLPPKAAEQAVATGQTGGTQSNPESYSRLYTDADVNKLARLLMGEAGGIPSKVEIACVAWTVCNQKDAGFARTLDGGMVPNHFNGLRTTKTPTDTCKFLARDVLERWSKEHAGYTNVGRVLPQGWCYFMGDRRRNYFCKNYHNGSISYCMSHVGDFSFPSPY